MIKHCVTFFLLLKRVAHPRTASLFPMDFRCRHVSLGCVVRGIESFDIERKKK